MNEVFTSYHESGHSIASLVLTGVPLAVRLYPSGGWASGAAGADGFDPPEPGAYTHEAMRDEVAGKTLDYCLNEAVILEAGHAACAIFCGRSQMPRTFTISAPDGRLVDCLARQAFGEALDIAVINAFGDLAYRRAVDLLGRRWAGVAAVAEKLITEKHLTSAEVAALFVQGLISECPL